MKIGISNCLNFAGYTETRRTLDRAVLAYYAGLKPSGYELVLHAVGSSKLDKEAAEGAGWQYMEMPNEDRGKKRNEALEDLRGQCDAIVRIGSDDIMSLALLDEVARRVRIGHEGSWELKGFYVYDLQGDNLALFHSKQFALAIRTDRMGEKSHKEASSGPDDAGLDIRWRGWGKPTYKLNHSDDRPMIAVSSGDELHGYKYYMSTEPLMCTMNNDARGYIEKHFPGFLGLFEAQSLTPKKAKTKKDNAGTT